MKDYKLTISSRPASGRKRSGKAVSGGSSTFIYSSTGGSVESSPSGSSTAIADTGSGIDTSVSTVGQPLTDMAWILSPTPTSVKASTAEPVFVSCSVEKIENGTNRRLTSTDELTAAGVALWAKIDEEEWQPYTIGRTKLIVARPSRRIITRSGKLLRTQGTDVDASSARHLISFELRDTADLGEVYATVNIPVVRDGIKGDSGPMVYPAGRWVATTTYKATELTRPVVEYGGQFYVLTAVGESTGVNPAGDYANNGDEAAWRLMDRFSYLFADVLMANFAKLGSAVFYEDYMFSQDGTINGEAVSGSDDNGVAYYTRFVDGKSAGSFIPNICVNFKSGYFAATVGVFSGNIRTSFVDLDKSDAVTDENGKYLIRTNHKLLTRRDGAVIELPDDEAMIGARVMICDPRLGGSSPRMVVIKPRSSGYIIGANPGLLTTTTTSGIKQIQMYAGVCELLAVPKSNASGELSPTGCQWMILTIAARYTNFTDSIYSGHVKDLPTLPGGIINDIAPIP